MNYPFNVTSCFQKMYTGIYQMDRFLHIPILNFWSDLLLCEQQSGSETLDLKWRVTLTFLALLCNWIHWIRKFSYLVPLHCWRRESPRLFLHLQGRRTPLLLLLPAGTLIWERSGNWGRSQCHSHCPLKTKTEINYHHPLNNYWTICYCLNLLC